MFYTYLIKTEGKYCACVGRDILSKKLPSDLCYFEVFGTQKEAKERGECLKKLSKSKLDSLIKNKKTGGFVCQNDGEKTVITIKSGVYNLTGAILVKGENIALCGEDNVIIGGCEKIDSWQNEGNGVYSASVEGDADALYISGEKYQMARFPKYNPNIKIFGGFSRDVLSKEKADTWQNPKGAYIHAMHRHNWGGFSYEVTGKIGRAHV